MRLGALRVLMAVVGLGSLAVYRVVLVAAAVVVVATYGPERLADVDVLLRPSGDRRQ